MEIDAANTPKAEYFYMEGDRLRLAKSLADDPDRPSLYTVS